MIKENSLILLFQTNYYISSCSVTKSGILNMGCQVYRVNVTTVYIQTSCLPKLTPALSQGNPVVCDYDMSLIVLILLRCVSIKTFYSSMNTAVTNTALTCNNYRINY